MIEAVVALAVVTIVLAAIGSLMATSMRGVRNLEQRVALIETARLIATDLARGPALLADDFGGVMSGHRWQLRVAPFSGGPVVPNSEWIPQLFELRVQSPSGAVLSLTTVRLLKRSGRS